MVKLVATQEAVWRVADELAAQGIEPTMTNVQPRTGGSYTTVKRHLESWEIERKNSTASPVEVPPEFEERGREFARALFSAACQQVRKEAAVEIAAVRAELDQSRAALAAAEAEVARLEIVEQEQAGALSEHKTRIHDLELKLAADAATISAKKARIKEVEHELADVRTTVAARDADIAAMRAQLEEYKGMAGLKDTLERMQQQLGAMATASGEKRS